MGREPVSACEHETTALVGPSLPSVLVNSSTEVYKAGKVSAVAEHDTIIYICSRCLLHKTSRGAFLTKRLPASSRFNPAADCAGTVLLPPLILVRPQRNTTFFQRTGR